MDPDKFSHANTVTTPTGIVLRVRAYQADAGRWGYHIEELRGSEWEEVAGGSGSGFPSQKDALAEGKKSVPERGVVAMDPNATLREILWRVDEIENGDTDRADELADHVRALHDWILKGGFLPDAWTAGTTERKQQP